MIVLLFNIILTNSVIFSFGALLSLFFFNERISKGNISEIPIFGIIFLSIIILFINFFLPINKIVGTAILILGLIFFTKIIINKSEINKKILKNIFLSSIVCFLILSYSNVYRPDAGLYHLPYISIINENKIIAGLANINFRYALASIVQYLSASQNNYIYSLEAISIPLASIFSFSIIFFIGEIFKNIKIKKNINSLIIFLISVFCFLSFGRFSNYGNDAVSHLYFFILIVFIINNYQNLSISNLKLNKLSLIAIFLFAAKPFMFLIILLPLLFFLYIKNKKKLFKTKLFYLNSVFLILWILKSIIISGCIIYPIDKTCFKSLKIYDEEKTIIEAKSGEAWAKDWVNRENVAQNFEEYNQNFNWVHTWKKVHLKKIIEKLLPYIVFLTIFLIVLIFQDKKTYKKLPSEINFIFFISIFLTLIWFLKFPLYRYGASFIVISIINKSKIMNRNIRILMAKPGLDGHDRGIKVLAAAYREAGMEVIYLGLRQTPEMIVSSALQEDVDVIALSSLNNGHMTIFPNVLNLMKSKGLSDVLLVGGGIIPKKDVEQLEGLGMGKLFGPGTPVQETIDYISMWVKENRR